MNSNNQLQGFDAFKSDEIYASEARSIKGADGLTQSGNNTYVGKNGDYVTQNDIGYSNGSTKKVGSPTMTWSWR